MSKKLFLKINWKLFGLIALIALLVQIIYNYFSFQLAHYWMGFSDILVFEGPLSSEVKLMALQLMATILGIGGALWVYYATKKKEQNDFVKIFVESIIEGGMIKIKTKLENPVNKKKYIKFAVIIISKYRSDECLNDTKEQFIEDLKKINLNIKDSDELHTLLGKLKYDGENTIFLPLPYYYYENERIGNEVLSYSYILNEIKKLNIGVYDVRFFVFSKEGHLHRCVHDSFYLTQEVIDASKISHNNQITK